MRSTCNFFHIWCVPLSELIMWIRFWPEFWMPKSCLAYSLGMRGLDKSTMLSHFVSFFQFHHYFQLSGFSCLHCFSNMEIVICINCRKKKKKLCSGVRTGMRVFP
jgi:hypothetical protein